MVQAPRIPIVNPFNSLLNHAVIIDTEVRPVHPRYYAVARILQQRFFGAVPQSRTFREETLLRSLLTLLQRLRSLPRCQRGLELRDLLFEPVDFDPQVEEFFIHPQGLTLFAVPLIGIPERQIRVDIFFVLGDGLLKLDDGLREVALDVVEHSGVVKYHRVDGVEFDCLLVVAERFLKLASTFEVDAEVLVDAWLFGVVFDGLRVMLVGQLGLALFLQDDGEVDLGLVVAWVQLDDLGRVRLVGGLPLGRL